MFTEQFKPDRHVGGNRVSSLTIDPVNRPQMQQNSTNTTTGTITGGNTSGTVTGGDTTATGGTTNSTGNMSANQSVGDHRAVVGGGRHARGAQLSRVQRAARTKVPPRHVQRTAWSGAPGPSRSPRSVRADDGMAGGVERERRRAAGGGVEDPARARRGQRIGADAVHRAGRPRREHEAVAVPQLEHAERRIVGRLDVMDRRPARRDAVDRQPPRCRRRAASDRDGEGRPVDADLEPRRGGRRDRRGEGERDRRRCGAAAGQNLPIVVARTAIGSPSCFSVVSWLWAARMPSA